MTKGEIAIKLKADDYHRTGREDKYNRPLRPIFPLPKSWQMSFNWSGYRPVSIIFTTIYSLLYMSFLKRVFVYGQDGSPNFCFINAMIFAFMTFVTNASLWEKRFSSFKKKIFSKYFTSFFEMLHRAKYLIYDYFCFLILLFSALMTYLPLLLWHSALIFHWSK